MKHLLNNHTAPARTARAAARMLAAAVMALSVLAGACTKDAAFGDDPSFGGEASLTVEVPFAVTGAGVRTRAGAEVQNLWVGVFDDTGKCVGMNLFGAVDAVELNGANVKIAPSVPPAGSKIAVDIFLDDEHPRVRLVGVANFTGVKAAKLPVGDGVLTAVPEETPLLGLLCRREKPADGSLGYTLTWSDLVSIAVATEGAEELMMGIFSSNGSINYTVDNEGKPSNTAWESSTVTDLTGAILGTGIRRPAGTIYLRPLISTVKINIAQGEAIELDNVRVSACNLPRYDYLQERSLPTDDNDNIKKSLANFRKQSPNVADAYIRNRNERRPASYTDIEEVELAADGSYSFRQFENKHWGRTVVATYNDREAKYLYTDGRSASDVFKSLCYNGEDSNDYGNNYNNFASYFEIEADVLDRKNNISGHAVFIVHEGYCNDANGNASSGNLRDFSCFRNTDYTYNVTINGLNSLKVNVTADSGSHNNGVTGGIYAVNVVEFDETGALQSAGEANVIKNLTGEQVGKMQWRVRTMLDDGASYNDVGFWETNFGDEGLEDPNFLGFPDLDEMAAYDPTVDPGFKAQIDGSGSYTMAELKEAAADWGTETHSVTVETPGAYAAESEVNLDKNARSLYLYFPGSQQTDADGCSAYTVYQFKQLPVDRRKSLKTEVTAVEFANSIETCTPEAVAGYVTGLAKASWTAASDDNDTSVENVVYSVYIDGTKLDDVTDETTYADFGAALLSKLTTGKHELKVVAKDLGGDYKEGESSKAFFVYPSTIDWTFGNSVYDGMVGGGTYYDKDSKFDGAEYYGITLGANVQRYVHPNTNTVRARTNGSNKEKNSLTFTALFDGVLTIVVSGTSGNPQNDRNIVVEDQIQEQQEIGGAVVSTPVTRTFDVSKGEICIWSTGSLDILSVKLSYKHAANKTWNFSSSQIGWSAFLQGLIDSGSDGKTVNEVFNGLHIVSGGTYTFRAGNDTNKGKYIQNTGRGNAETEEQVFWFETSVPGTISAKVTHSGSSAPAYVRSLMFKRADLDEAAVIGTTENALSNVTTAKSISAHTGDITAPTKIYVYPTCLENESDLAVMRIYEISFTPDAN